MCYYYIVLYRKKRKCNLGERGSELSPSLVSKLIMCL